MERNKFEYYIEERRTKHGNNHEIKKVILNCVCLSKKDMNTRRRGGGEEEQKPWKLTEDER